jgi:SAM-dependent methyltransferase
LERPAVLFSEATRLLRPGGELVVVTDSPEDLLARSLTRYFPETLEHEQQRYPAPEALDSQARDASLETLPRVTAHGELSLSPDFVAKLEDRCASALRLLSDEAHTQGIERVRKAAARGELWRSHYTLYRYRKPTPPGP